MEVSTINEKLLKILRKLRDLWIYFKTGHSSYLIYTMSIMNFIVLQHRLLISYIPFLNKYLGSLTTFIIFFAITYTPLAISIGILEFRKGESKRRPKLNPFNQDILIAEVAMIDGLIGIAQKCNNPIAIENLQKAREIKSRWIK